LISQNKRLQVMMFNN